MVGAMQTTSTSDALGNIGGTSTTLPRGVLSANKALKLHVENDAVNGERPRTIRQTAETLPRWLRMATLSSSCIQNQFHERAVNDPPRNGDEIRTKPRHFAN